MRWERENTGNKGDIGKGVAILYTPPQFEVYAVDEDDNKESGDT